MSRASNLRASRSTDYPRNAWYVLATSDEVGDAPLARRVLGVPIVLFRTTDGTAVALEDRDAHKPYPLSLGRVDGDTIVSGYSGFAYDATGRCVHVPNQDEIPVGARVPAYPVHDDGVFVWCWLGDPARSGLRPPPPVGWLKDADWTTVGDAWETAAHAALLHENFADITHVAVVDPFIAPPVLSGSPPPLEVEVTETTVSFSRDYPPAPIAAWHAELLGLPTDAEHAQRESGAFVTPGLWVDRWEVQAESDGDQPVTFIFSHAVTPISADRTRHVWRVSRNFARGDQASKILMAIFTDYYRRVQTILETMQTVLDGEGPRKEVHVSADAAALQVRKILRNMVSDEGASARG